jgi:hypothetical protein
MPTGHTRSWGRAGFTGPELAVVPPFASSVTHPVSTIRPPGSSTPPSWGLSVVGSGGDLTRG